MGRSIDRRVDLGKIRYANCWEDADILCDALRPAPGRRFLSIASAGDNSLALLAGGCEVIAVDLSQAQLACLELRVVCFRHLSYDELLCFLGVHESKQRLRTYRSLSSQLSATARDFWDRRSEAIETGIIHAGKFERYFQKFRRWVLPLVHGHRRVSQLLEEKEPLQRRSFFEQRWNSWSWRLMFRIFFSRFVMGRLGRDPEFFRYVEGSVADRILERTEYALTQLPTHTNPYLRYILTGNFQAVVPRYLRPESFEQIRSGLDRLTMFQGSIEVAAKRFGEAGFDGYNLSDVFEYLDADSCREIFAQLLQTSHAGARLAYWNMLAPRQCPPPFDDRVRSLEEEAGKLFSRDQAFFYSRFVVEEVV